MAQCGQNEASHAASCVLFTEGSWREWGVVTQNSVYDGSSVNCCSGLTLTGLPSPGDTQQRDSSPRWVTSLRPVCVDQSSFFFLPYLWVYFKTQPFFRERDWDFPSYYAHQWIPVAQGLAHELRISPFMSATGRNGSVLFGNICSFWGDITFYILLWDAFTLLCSSCCVSYLFMECYFIHEVLCVTEKPDLSLIMKTSLCLLIKDRWVSHKGTSQLSLHPQVESWLQDLASTNLPCLQYLKCPEKFIGVHFFTTCASILSGQSASLVAWFHYTRKFACDRHVR